MKVLIHWGIDPGKTGAIAALNPRGGAAVYDMPEAHMLMSLLQQFADPDHVWLEKAWAHPKQGVTSIGHMMQSYGYLQCALDVRCGFEKVHEISPQSWKKYFWPNRILPGDELTKDQKKALTEKERRHLKDERKKQQKIDSLQLAHRLFNHPRRMLFDPECFEHNGRAEALLIAKHGAMTYGEIA